MRNLLGVVLFIGLAACGSRSEETKDESTRVATDTLVETRQVADTLVVRTDSIIAADTAIQADTTIAADTTVTADTGTGPALFIVDRDRFLDALAGAQRVRIYLPATEHLAPMFEFETGGFDKSRHLAD